MTFGTLERRQVVITYGLSECHEEKCEGSCIFVRFHNIFLIEHNGEENSKGSYENGEKHEEVFQISEYRAQHLNQETEFFKYSQKESNFYECQ